MFRQTEIFRYMNNTAPFGRNRPIRSNMRLSRTELEDVRKFRAFNNEKANGHCTMCMRVLYPEEQKFRRLTEEWIICRSWNINPITNENGDHMVCFYHLSHNGTVSSSRNDNRRVSEGQQHEPETPEDLRNQFVYPGKK